MFLHVCHMHPGCGACSINKWWTSTETIISLLWVSAFENKAAMAGFSICFVQRLLQKTPIPASCMLRCHFVRHSSTGEETMTGGEDLFWEENSMSLRHRHHRRHQRHQSMLFLKLLRLHNFAILTNVSSEINFQFSRLLTCFESCALFETFFKNKIFNILLILTKTTISNKWDYWYFSCLMWRQCN